MMLSLSIQFFRIIIIISLLLHFVSAFAQKKNKVENCRFSNTGEIVLVSEYDTLLINQRKMPLFALYRAGSEQTDSVVINNDTVYFIAWDNATNNFRFINVMTYDSLVEIYNLYKIGIDYSDSINIHYDSVFVRRGHPLKESIPDSNYIISNYFNLIITYSLPGKLYFSDTIYSTNASIAKQNDELRHTSVIRVYDVDSVFMGTIGYPSKLFADKESRFIFLRTIYLAERLTTISKKILIESVDNTTSEVISIGYSDRERHIRKIIKNTH